MNRDLSISDALRAIHMGLLEFTTTAQDACEQLCKLGNLYDVLDYPEKEIQESQELIEYLDNFKVVSE